MKRFVTKFVALGMLALSAPLVAAPTPAELAAASQAETTGAEMFAYDQAAWHATDRFQEDYKAKGQSFEQLRDMGFHGYIVEPDKGGQLLTTFYGEKDGKSFALARYVVSASTVSSGGMVQPDSDNALSPLALRMIVARDKALTAFMAPNHNLCSNSPANSLVLPPRTDGTIPVYILTSTTDSDVYPAGGHFRFDFDVDGKLVNERRFMNSCFPIDSKPKDGIHPEVMVLTHSLDSQPTEIHAFVSRNIPMSLVVITITNKAEWWVSHGHIQYVQDVPKK